VFALGVIVANFFEKNQLLDSPVVHYEVIAPDATFNYKRSSAGFVDIGALQEEFSQIRH
jgi:hypothetical protein